MLLLMNQVQLIIVVFENVSNSNFVSNSARYWAGAIHTHCNA